MSGISTGVHDDDEMVQVQFPSGALFPVHEQELDYITERVTDYTTQLRFVATTHKQDLDRVMLLELMVFRWGQFLSRGRDYAGDPIEPDQTQKQIKEWCVDGATECLTRQGWRTHSALVLGDELLTLNPSTGLSEWQPVWAVNRWDGAHEVRHLRTLWHDSMTTLDHRWLVHRTGLRPRDVCHLRWRTTRDLDRYDRVLMAVPHASLPSEPKYSDSFVELVAWWWTEGSCTRPALSNGEIGQSDRANPGKVAAIRRALSEAFGQPGPMRGGARWNETRRSDVGFVLFNLSAEATRLLERCAPDQCVAPDFLLSLTQSQLLLFIDRSVDGDGSRGRYRAGGEEREARVITQAREANLRAFEFACVLAGISTHTYLVPAHEGRFGTSPYWTTSLMRKTECAPAVAEDERCSVEGVWCPTVPNGLWLARREGTVFYTGNSGELRQLKKQLALDKATMDRVKGDDSVAAYLANLLVRAREFGVMRERQLGKALELMNELKALLTLHDNTDEIERREMHLEMEDVLEWVRNVAVPEYDAIDAYFREHQQRLWVRSM